MFEFLFKRPADKSDTPAGKSAQASPNPAPQPSQTSVLRAQQAEKVAGLKGDEAAAVEFILQSDFSELRLAAAEHVHTAAQLEKVHAAMRNTDRRVAKLMQSRLDALRHHQAELGRGQACIEQAQALLKDDKLSPNQVADLDRRWSVIAAPELAEQFNAIRAQLAQRLEAQVTLQRSMIDSLGALRALGTGGLRACELAERLEQMAQAQAAALAAPEHASLPRSLTNEFASEHARLTATLGALEQGQSAVIARETALAEWRATPPGAFNQEQLKKAWQQLPPAPAADAADLQQRFEELLALVPAPVAAPGKPAKEARKNTPAQAPDQHFLDALDAMEAALQQGSLGSAAEMDKILKDSKGTRLTPALSDRLAHARAELKRLSDWARWGGNVSREELIKAVEQLTTQKLAMSELAKKVGSMRERWKALDTLSGAAPKSLWERFDAACSAAYAPAAAHFKHLADERHTNAAKAQALIAEAAQETAKLAEGGSVDWKHMAATVQRMRLAWSHLGAIDRKEKKRLDHEFTDALNTLQAPLEQQRKNEVAEREAMIAQVAALDAHDRHALDTLRALQERWQEHARALPLERKSEQALWQKFRAACDAVFARRKESANAADAERRSHQEAKDAISARLELAAGEPDAAANAARLLREAGAEWNAIGAVPRANEAKVEKRYHAAIAALQHHVDAAKRDASRAQASALRDKLRLCQELEAAVAAGGEQADSIDSSDWAARWSALPALDANHDRTLKARFDAALAARGEGRAAFAALLEKNRAPLLHEILRLEIAAGIDSGSEFARERLKLQVETLQSSLKSGQKPGNQAARFLQLCAMPALVDDRTASRIEHLFTRIARDGK
ncbi:DUF349 domain-containing protein [Massilia violaceinigra]|uniref:DUF349 domain-containing protein n=1 Tax=Massilia violaceinigra TaxID=2045208 RepID=A0ABY4A5X8_9BURK|nr:DUF349 domain-containing protein [Massilia violaceinigra]UOD30184.1 DUF349 domain-containing protein [Massilia violaceinigra]